MAGRMSEGRPEEPDRGNRELSKARRMAGSVSDAVHIRPATKRMLYTECMLSERTMGVRENGSAKMERYRKGKKERRQRLVVADLVGGRGYQIQGGSAVRATRKQQRGGRSGVDLGGGHPTVWTPPPHFSVYDEKGSGECTSRHHRPSGGNKRDHGDWKEGKAR